VAFGVHTPEHTPETQAWFVHASADPQFPVELHVWTALPTHCVAPGVHTPVLVHAPPTHDDPDGHVRQLEPQWVESLLVLYAHGVAPPHAEYPEMHVWTHDPATQLDDAFATVHETPQPPQLAESVEGLTQVGTPPSGAAQLIPQPQRNCSNGGTVTVAAAEE
jgi:hypothetical protein